MAAVPSSGPIKLPRGRHGLSREQVRQHQRIRMLEAMARSVGEKGYAATTVQDVLERAGVSRKTFYEHFHDKEACFLEAYDAVVRRVMTAGARAYGDTGSWSDGVRRGLATFLRFFAYEPALARMAMVEVLAAGPDAIERYRTAITSFIPYLEEGRQRSRYRDQLPESISEMVARGVAFTIHSRVAAGAPEQVPSMLPDLVYFVLVPFVGHAEAAREASRAREERAQAEGDDEGRTRARGA